MMQKNQELGIIGCGHIAKKHFEDINTSHPAPLFSVVIPLYNKEPHIGRALDSVLAQTYSDFENIVIDDGSTDKGPEIVKYYANEKITLIQQKNAGVSRARNRGIKESNGLLIAFLDADDIYLPHFLETIVRLHQKFPEAGIYGTAAAHCYPNKSELNIYGKEEGERILKHYFRDYLTHGLSIIYTCSFAAPKTILEAVGLYSEYLSIAEDNDLYAKIALSYPVAYSPSICSCYYCYTVNNTRGKLKPPVEAPFIRYLSTFPENELKKRNDYDNIKEYCDFVRLIIADACYKSGHFAYARCLIMKTHYRRYLKMKIKFFLFPFIPTSTQKALQKLDCTLRDMNEFTHLNIQILHRVRRKKG
jgi:glycosyltransferase involved in cell wall biosynthesis